MKLWYFNMVVIMFISSIGSNAYAGAALDQRMQAARQQRVLQQQQLQQQAIAQQQQVRQRAAIQQQISQRQVQVMQQQMARQRQQAQIGQQQIIAQQLKQQSINQQQAAYQQMQRNQQQLYQQQLQSQPQAQQLAYAPADFSKYPSYETHVEEVVDMGMIWKDLAISSEAWPLIIDMNAKEIIVAKFIEDYRKQGVIINKTPIHYAQLIDSMSFDNPDMLHNSFDKILQIVAIIEYDYDNGTNPDALAKQILGDKGYMQNKERLGK